MRYLINLTILVALLLAVGCVFRSSEEENKPASLDPGLLVDGNNGESMADTTDGMLSRERPEGVSDDEIIRIEVPAMTPEGDTGTGLTPPPGAENITGPVAKNYNAEFVEVRPFDDPDNPYLGQYTDFDRWHFDNFDPGAPMMMSAKPDEQSGALVVTDDGWAEPYLVSMRKSLEYETGQDVDASQISKDLKLYARGILATEIEAEVSASRAMLTAEFAPAIPHWLAKAPPLWSLVLPDGHVATVGLLGSGSDFYPEDPNWYNDVKAPACHYDPDGKLVERLEPGLPWIMLFFPELETVMEQHGVTSIDVQVYGRYVVLRNRDDDTLSGFYRYDGTPVTEEQRATTRDATRHFEMYGRYVPVMYGIQQGLVQ